MLEELGGESVGWGHMIETKAGVILPEQNLLISANGVLLVEPGATIAGAGSSGAEEPGEEEPKEGEPEAGKPGTGSKTPPGKGKQTPQQAVKKKIAEASTGDDDDDERKKREEEFLAAWLLLLNRKKKEIEDETMINAAQVRRAFSFSDDDIQELTVIMITYRLMVFVQTWNGLPKTSWDNPEPVDINELIQREVDRTVERARGVVDTWNSDVNVQADSIEAISADVDELTQKLMKWMDGRVDWKGKSIGITEWTDAESMASEAWAEEHQSHSVGRHMRWKTMGDDKVCKKCRELDGTIVDPKEQRPPLHTNCRCHLEDIGY